jgi:hypothetical protein
MYQGVYARFDQSSGITIATNTPTAAPMENALMLDLFQLPCDM